MKKSVQVIILTLLTVVPGLPQKAENSFVVVSYNVENLFDTVDAPQFQDEDFTPGGIKRWTYERYEKKLDDLSRVILSIPEREMPAIIGLAEVENRNVLSDLPVTGG
jgi:predicted extracellular nuclease